MPPPFRRHRRTSADDRCGSGGVSTLLLRPAGFAAAVAVLLAALLAGPVTERTGGNRLQLASAALPSTPQNSPLVPARPWRWPLPGRPEVIRPFDPPATPYGPGHRGVDLGAAPGIPVLAAGAGVVAWAGILAGRGVISVRHAGGLRTTYEAVVPAVHVGQTVAAGARLGLLAAGHPGCPRPACLHWGLLRGQVYLDPLRLLRAVAVRLLPLGRDSAGSAVTGTIPISGAPAASVAAGPGGTGPAPATAAAQRSSRPALVSPTATVTTMGLALIGAMVLSRRRPP